MENTRSIDSYTIRVTNEIVKVGDCVLIHVSKINKRPSIAKIVKIEADSRNNVNVHVRWYYSPDHTRRGRRGFHGAKELHLSDHYDLQSADRIQGKCMVYSLYNYNKLDIVRPHDYYFRFQYKHATGDITPRTVEVFCKCALPYNPDKYMMQCVGCKNWFHPACVHMTIEEAANLDHYVCPECFNNRV